MKNTILILTIFAIVIKGLFILGVDSSNPHTEILNTISNLLIVAFSFLGLFCQWMGERNQTTYEEV